MGYLYQLMEQSYFLFNERNVTELFFLSLLLTIGIWVSVDDDDGTSTLMKRETRVYGEEKSIFHLFLFLVLCGCGQIMEDKAKCTM